MGGRGHTQTCFHSIDSGIPVAEDRGSDEEFCDTACTESFPSFMKSLFGESSRKRKCHRKCVKFLHERRTNGNFNMFYLLSDCHAPSCSIHLKSDKYKCEATIEFEEEAEDDTYYLRLYNCKKRNVPRDDISELFFDFDIESEDTYFPEWEGDESVTSPSSSCAAKEGCLLPQNRVKYHVSTMGGKLYLGLIFTDDEVFKKEVEHGVKCEEDSVDISCCATKDSQCNGRSNFMEVFEPSTFDYCEGRCDDRVCCVRFEEKAEDEIELDPLTILTNIGRFENFMDEVLKVDHDEDVKHLTLRSTLSKKTEEATEETSASKSSTFRYLLFGTGTIQSNNAEWWKDGNVNKETNELRKHIAKNLQTDDKIIVALAALFHPFWRMEETDRGGMSRHRLAWAKGTFVFYWML